MMEAELFDGTVLEFPDGTSPEVIQRVVKQQTATKRGVPLAEPAQAVEQAPVQTAPEDVVGANGIPGGTVSEQPIERPRERTFMDALTGTLDYADDTGANFFRGARRGVAGVVGLPVDVVNNAPRALNLLPGVDGVGPMSDQPFMGSQFVDDMMGGFGALPETPEPVDALQRGARRMGQEIGAAAVPVGTALGVANKIGVEGARQLPNITRMFVEPAAVNAGKYAAKETAVTLGAGGGAAVANEMFDPGTSGGQFADLVGALAGASAVGAGGMIASGGGQVINALRQNPNYIDDVVREAVVDRLGRAANVPGSEIPGGTMDTSSLVNAIENPNRQLPSEVIPGYADSLADRTANPGLAALEYGRQQGPNAGAFVERRSANSEAVDGAMSRLEPQATPGMLREELALERDRRMMDAQVGRMTAEDEVVNAIRGLLPETQPAQRGNTVRTALEEARDAARSRTEEAYNAADVASKQVDPAPLADDLNAAVNSLTEVERGLVPQGMIDRVAALGRPTETGPQPTGILDASGNPITRDPAGPEAIALKEATDLKSELQRLQRAAVSDPRAERGGRNAARVLGQFIDTVDGYIARNLSPEENAALDTARGAKFDEAEAFTRTGDPVAQALARNEGGMPKMRDDRVAGAFVNPQAMDRLFAQADTPDVRSAIRDEVLSRGDTSSADRINQFTQQYGEQLDRFPGLRDELAKAAQARTREADAKGVETNLQRELGTDTQPGRSTVGRYLQFSDATAERAMSEVLAAKDPGKAADELLGFINDKPQAVEGARAAFWKKLKSESQSVDNSQRSMGGKRAWRGDWLKGWLNNPSTKAVAERLYRDKPEDLDLLNAYADVLDNADLRTRGKAVGTSGTGQGVSNILTPETLQSRMYAYMRGQISGTYLATSIGAVVARRAIRAARGDAIERLTDKVLLNPEIAKELLKENNPANRAAMARKAKGWLGNEASTFVNMMNEDDDRDPTVKALEGGNDGR